MKFVSPSAEVSLQVASAPINPLLDMAVDIQRWHPVLFWVWVLLIVAWVACAVMAVICVVQLTFTLFRLRQLRRHPRRFFDF